ncbi:uncharacterized protein LOC142545716 isoform X2 [Primulina tabacum]|uniref:uncharacterized protein LOC142545716 isoform X2 n=1 Tax=Primulina tabacum TaxID=48773 RepID=UPI003F599ADC
MAGVLNLTDEPTFSPLFNGAVRRTTGYFLENNRQLLQKAHCQHGRRQSLVQEFSISAPRNFRDPQPKPFSVRPDKDLDILGASLALYFRLSTSLLSGSIQTLEFQCMNLMTIKYLTGNMVMESPISALSRPIFWFVLYSIKAAAQASRDMGTQD